MPQETPGPVEERRFNREQYDFLKQCSEKGEEGIREWNEWRKANPRIDICLDGADMRGWYLRGVNLAHFKQQCDDQIINYSAAVYSRKANLCNVKAERALFQHAHLQNTMWWGARLCSAIFRSARLNHAELGGSRLTACNFNEACLSDASLAASVMQKAQFNHSDLRGCSARGATVDGKTDFWECKLDRKADFTGVALGNVIIDPATKQLLEYNIRRANWERWYKGHPILRWLVRLFWLASDYGVSTGRIVGTFLGLAALFALAYWLWPRCVIVCGTVGDIRGFLHAFYFSVVTMTTLGFGDIAANPDSWQGQVLLMIQVIMGYVLLGALVTRFAVLFTAGGPAGRFSKPERTRPT